MSKDYSGLNRGEEHMESSSASSEKCTDCSDLRDALFPTGFKTYADFIGELNDGAVYEGLLAWGMLGDKLPPVLTSVPFYDYCVSKSHGFTRKWYGWITYRYERNIGRYREYGIPNPFGYELLSQEIASHWSEIIALLSKNTEGHAYKVSRIHPRKQSGSSRIFEMNYKQWWADSDPIPAVLIGRRYLVSCDVSRCFPSMYTHAIDWAIRGKENSKGRKREKSWASEIDTVAAATTFGETHGLLIGPHSSNVLAELVLTAVDQELYQHGFRFVRNIDDYTCYAETKKEADEFIISLERELAKFRLSINQQKTAIANLPNAVTENWVHALRGFRFSSNSRLNFKDVESFLDTAVNLMDAAGGNQSVLLYAMKVLSGKKLTTSARRYYADMASHLTCLYPYLVPYFEDSVIVPTYMEEGRIRIIATVLFGQAIERRDYLTACYALYFGAKYEFELDGVNAEQIIESNDCLLMLFAFLYSQKVDDIELRETLIMHAESIADNDSEEDFDRYWLFIYEALPVAKLPEGDWRGIKKAGVSFVDLGKMNKPDFSSDIAKAHFEELLAIGKDDHGEEDPSLGSVNEL